MVSRDGHGLRRESGHGHCHSFRSSSQRRCSGAPPSSSRRPGAQRERGLQPLGSRTEGVPPCRRGWTGAALTDEAFSVLKDQPRYELDGSARLQAHLRASTGRADLVVGPADIKVIGSEASSATSAQWAVVRQLQAALPDADITLREHRLSWRQDPQMPGLTVFGALVIRHVGPFILRREFAVPER